MQEKKLTIYCWSMNHRCHTDKVLNQHVNLNDDLSEAFVGTASHTVHN